MQYYRIKMGASILLAVQNVLPLNFFVESLRSREIHFYKQMHMFFVSGCQQKICEKTLVAEPAYPFFDFIRTCQNPIGTTQPKNWNLWLSHMIWALCSKCDRILLRWGRDLNQSYREGTREGARDGVFLIELLLEAKNAKKIKKCLKKIKKTLKFV